MAINDQRQRFAGWQAIVRGVDSGRAPAVLSPDSLTWAINATMRGGFPTCRPGWDERLNLTEEIDDATVLLWQGASGYVSDSGRGTIICSISGRIFAVDPVSYSAVELTGSDTNASNLPKTWFAQAENYLAIQNASDDAFVYDGASLTRSVASAKGGKGIPIGGPMSYANGRLWVSLAPESNQGDFYSFTAGDLAYSNGSRSAVLQFTEREYLNGGGNFSVPANGGPIRSLMPIAAQDTATGQGPLQVFTTRCCFSVNAPFDRTEWANLRSPIQTISLLAAGASSDTATVNVNGDIWFRSGDGIRSFAIAQRDHGTWVNTPLSREVSRALDYDTPHLLQYSSAALFDNRLLCTTRPERVTDTDGNALGIVHNGLVILDFAPVSTIFDRTQPTWEGIWTGLRILQIVPLETETRRLFLFALNSENQIVMYELSTANRFDNTDNRIQWVLETPSYGFDDGGWSLKQLQYGDQWSDRIAGDVDFRCRFRPDAYPFWVPWHSWSVCAPYTSCDADCNTTSSTKQEQYRSRQRLPSPTTEADSVHGTPYRQAYRFQARLEITGHARIRQFRMVAIDVPEPNRGSSL